MESARWDETWHRLLIWTNSSAQAERLAAQILVEEGFTGIDPSHPLGGADGGRDMTARLGDKSAVAAVYFPRGQKTFSEIKSKFERDLASARTHSPEVFAFITNQELRLSERKELRGLGGPEEIEILHLERLTTILDKPGMAPVREQFLGIGGELSQAVFNFGGQGGQAPGAGGGGGGAIGEGAVAGNGGEGGQIVTATFRADELPNALQIRVGRGGEGGRDGGAGEDGGDTEIVGLLRAKGGHGGRGARNALPKGPTPVGLYLADAVNCREGLVGILGGGWERVTVQAVPCEADWLLAVSVDLGKLPAGEQVIIGVAVRLPSGAVVLEKKIGLCTDGRPISLRHFGVPLHVPVTETGMWRIQLLVSDDVIAERPLEVCT